MKPLKDLFSEISKRREGQFLSARDTDIDTHGIFNGQTLM
jgi:hypothetical protein